MEARGPTLAPWPCRFFALAWAVAHELRTSRFSPPLFLLGRQINYTVAPGAVPASCFLKVGLDSRLVLQDARLSGRLEAGDLWSQSRLSFHPPETNRWELPPIGICDAAVYSQCRGLRWTSASGICFRALTTSAAGGHTLLFMENRELVPEPTEVSANPVWRDAWPRQDSPTGSKLGLRLRRKVGST
jgi:hypothetical protein